VSASNTSSHIFGSYVVLAILFLLLIVLGVYPARIMTIIETISAFI